MNISLGEQKHGPGWTPRFHKEKFNNEATTRLGSKRAAARYRRGISKRYAGSCAERNFGGRQCAPILIVGNPSSTKGWKKRPERRSPEGEDRDRIKARHAEDFEDLRCNTRKLDVVFPFPVSKKITFRRQPMAKSKDVPPR